MPVLILLTVEGLKAVLRNLLHHFSLMKSSENKFYFFTCILVGYVAHESPKEFLEYSHFENMRAGFLLRCQNSLWQTTP